MGGGVPFVPAPGAQSSRDVIPVQLLDGGNHFDNLEYQHWYNIIQNNPTINFSKIFGYIAAFVSFEHGLLSKEQRQVPPSSIRPMDSR
jgi:hypothetical protein